MVSVLRLSSNLSPQSGPPPVRVGLPLQEDEGRCALGAAALCAQLKTVACQDGHRAQSHAPTVDPPRTTTCRPRGFRSSLPCQQRSPRKGLSTAQAGLDETRPGADGRCSARARTVEGEDTKVSGYDESPPPKGWALVEWLSGGDLLSHTVSRCSTIGAERLSFRVRNGTGRFPLAMTAVTLWRCQPGSRPYLGNRTVDA